jgi:hypothetical protein
MLEFFLPKDCFTIEESLLELFFSAFLGLATTATATALAPITGTLITPSFLVALASFTFFCLVDSGD